MNSKKKQLNQNTIISEAYSLLSTYPDRTQKVFCFYTKVQKKYQETFNKSYKWVILKLVAPESESMPTRAPPRRCVPPSQLRSP